MKPNNVLIDVILEIARHARLSFYELREKEKHKILLSALWESV